MGVDDYDMFEFFNKHVYYEMTMLRSSADRLETIDDQFEWNVMFVAFLVYARNISDFLRNKGNSNDARALDFDPYRSVTRQAGVEEVKEINNLVHAECLHMGRKRYTEADKKLGLTEVRELRNWVVLHMGRFKASLNDDAQKRLRWEWNTLLAPTLPLGPVAPNQLTASSLPILGCTGPIERRNRVDGSAPSS